MALAADLDDMRHATATPVHPEACDVEGLTDCTAVVVAVRAAFTNAHAADVRMAGAAANAPVIRALATSLRGYQGTVLMVTNPVRPDDPAVRRSLRLPARVWHRLQSRLRPSYRLTLARLLNVPRGRRAGARDR
ncbi:hypothetical protein ACWDE9_06495 [Streptomyces olivaceoviridis]